MGVLCYPRVFLGHLSAETHRAFLSRVAMEDAVRFDQLGFELDVDAILCRAQGIAQDSRIWAGRYQEDIVQ